MTEEGFIGWDQMQKCYEILGCRGGAVIYYNSV